MIRKIWSTVDGDKLIVYMARVSNPKGQDNEKTSPKLISYLIKHKHWSPFEMVNLVVEINTTRDIGRQILRHRSFSFQEFSQRYSSIENLEGPVYRETRLQNNKNRQNSIHNNDLKLDNDFQTVQKEVWETCKFAYLAALDNGIAKEQARALLPEGLTPTRMYMNGNLRSWIHFLEARLYEGAQKEIREIAQQIGLIIKENFPMTHQAWSETR